MTTAQLGEQARLMSIPIFISFVGLVVLLSDLVFNREDERRWPAYLTIAGLVGSLFLWIQSWLAFHPPTTPNAFVDFLQRLNLVPAPAQPGLLFNEMYDPNGYASLTLLSSLLLILVAMIVTLIAPAHLERRGLQRGEFYALILFATAGGIFMAGSNHLMLIFLALELLSIPLYILAGFARPNLRSQESALKYFLLGAFASSFLLYGIALVYGATGSMHLSEIRDLLLGDMQSGAPSIAAVDGGINLMVLAGLTMLLVGMSFKISVVPFHQWTPDVYEGAPTPVTAFMVAATKIAAITTLLNILIGFYALSPWWTLLITILSVLTMVVGNVGALVQTNIKRMLAYSSIAHAGYMLVGVTVLGRAFELQGIILYLAVYAMMNLGAFAVLLAMEEATGREIIELEDFSGLARDHPGLSILLGFFLLSLAGFPPTAGFFGKFFLFTAAVLGGQIWLVVIAVALSVLSIYYYARFIIAMFMQPRSDDIEESGRARPSWMVGTALAVTLVFVLGMGLFPNPILSLFQ